MITKIHLPLTLIEFEALRNHLQASPPPPELAAVYAKVMAAEAQREAAQRMQRFAGIVTLGHAAFGGLE